MSGIPFSATLETLKAKHDRVRTSDQRAGARLSARKLAAAQGVPVPDWAQIKQPEARKPMTRAQSPHPATPWRERPKREQRSQTIAVSSVLPEALRAWRQRNAPSGAVVHLGQQGVSLITLESTQTYPSIAEAVEAIQPTRKQA